MNLVRAYASQVANPQIAEFYHPSFQMGRPDLLPLVMRKARRHGGHGEAQEAATQPPVPRAARAYGDYRPQATQHAGRDHASEEPGSGGSPHGGHVLGSMGPPSPLARAGASDKGLLERFGGATSAEPQGNHGSSSLLASNAHHCQADRFAGDLNFDFSNSMPWGTSNHPAQLQLQASYASNDDDAGGGDLGSAESEFAADVKQQLAAVQMAFQQLAAEHQTMRHELEAARQSQAATDQRLNAFLLSVQDACLKTQANALTQAQAAIECSNANAAATAHNLAAAAVAEAVAATLGVATVGVGSMSSCSLGGVSSSTATTTTTTQTTVVTLDMESVAGAVTAALAEHSAVTAALAEVSEAAAAAADGGAAVGARAQLKRPLSNDSNACGHGGSDDLVEMATLKLQMSNDAPAAGQGAVKRQTSKGDSPTSNNALAADVVAFI